MLIAHKVNYDPNLMKTTKTTLFRIYFRLYVFMFL